MNTKYIVVAIIVIEFKSHSRLFSVEEEYVVKRDKILVKEVNPNGDEAHLSNYLEFLYCIGDG